MERKEFSKQKTKIANENSHFFIISDLYTYWDVDHSHFAFTQEFLVAICDRLGHFYFNNWVHYEAGHGKTCPLFYT